VVQPVNLYYWPTPNGRKITIFLEEVELPYNLIPVNIGQGEQFQPDFLALSPNNRIPALVDLAPPDGGAQISLFESGAILIYLAEKTGCFLPQDLRQRCEVMKWLFWQVGGLGPMAGQCHFFRRHAPEQIPYAIERYTDEVKRLYGVMEQQLKEREFLAGKYSISDIAAWPWIQLYAKLGQDIETFPHLYRWFKDIQERPAVQRGFAMGKEPRQVRFSQTNS
jgi:GST-like protein